MSAKNLRRIHDPTKGEYFVAAFCAMFVGLPIAVVGGTCGLNASVGAFALVLLWRFDIPPYRLAPRFRKFVVFMVVIGIAAVSWLFEWIAAFFWSVGIVVAGWFVAVAYSVVVARMNFYRLQEIQLAGASVFRPPEGVALASHVTDVHVTEADDVGTVEDNGESGSGAFRNWLRKAAVDKTRFLIVSGDLTDTGSPVEWSRVNAAAEAARLSDQFLIAAPGNHDLFRGYGSSNECRLRQYFEFLVRNCPSLVTAKALLVADMEAQAGRETVAQVEWKANALREEHRVALVQFRKRGDPQERLSAADHREISDDLKGTDWIALARSRLRDEWFESGWYDHFPLTMWDGPTQTLVVVVNSVLHGADTLGESALGRYGDAQLSRLKSTLGALPPTTRNVLVATHHAPFRAPGDWRLFVPWVRGGFKRTITRIQEFCFLAHTVDEARRFLELLCDSAAARQDVRFLVFCGHRHSPAVGWAGPVLVIEGSALASVSPTETLVQAGSSVVLFKRSLDPTAERQAQ